jgi:hypothetical protein
MKKQKILSEKERVRTSTNRRMKKSWRKPKLNDVTGEVMAQPFIRFT